MTRPEALLGIDRVGVLRMPVTLMPLLLASPAPRMFFQYFTPAPRGDWIRPAACVWYRATEILSGEEQPGRWRYGVPHHDDDTMMRPCAWCPGKVLAVKPCGAIKAPCLASYEVLSARLVRRGDLTPEDVAAAGIGPGAAIHNLARYLGCYPKARSQYRRWKNGDHLLWAVSCRRLSPVETGVSLEDRTQEHQVSP